MKRRGAIIFLAVMLVIAASALGRGVYAYVQREQLATESQKKTKEFVPNLQAREAERVEGPSETTLPGQTSPIEQARLFARATGFIAERKVDIGSRVKKGDLLARIAAPDLDQELAQARAALGQYEAQIRQAKASTEQARANFALARVTNDRTAKLADQGFQSRQRADDTSAALQTQQAHVDAALAAEGVADANLKAQAATVNRLTELTGFKDVVAPFDGVVTTRGVEVGDHVTADASGSATPLFTLANDKVLRVQVYVPQSAAAGIRSGLNATVTVPELPGREFTGRVARDAAALRSSTRALLVEVDVPNADGELRAGLYANVRFSLPRTTPAVVVPAESLIFDSDGMRVAIVSASGRVEMRKVEIARDYGARVEIKDGLVGGEQVVLRPPTGLSEGTTATVRLDQPQGKVASRN